MKSVLISIQPKWVEKICSGKKTIEVRKTRPKIETPFKCYIYCTEGDALAYPCINYPKFDIHRANNGTLKGRLMTKKEREQSDYLFANGKVIGEFVCEKIDEWKYLPDGFVEDENEKIYYISSVDGHATCLTYDEIENYGKGKTLFGWHISDLVIYDKPKELSEFRKPFSIDDNRHMKDWCHNHCEICDEKNCKYDLRITRPPQSWCYIESLGE